ARLLAGRQVGGDSLGDVDRDGEADRVDGGAPRFGGRDAHDLAGEVEQRAAGVAGVDGGVGLDRGAQATVVFGDIAAESGDDTRGDGAGQAQRVADGDDAVTGLEGEGTAEVGGG